MRRFATTIVLVGMVGLAACGPSPSEQATGEPSDTAAEPTQGTEQEAEAARQAAEREKQKAVAAAKQRLEALREEVSDLDSRSAAVRASLDETLRASLVDVPSRLDEVDRKVDAFAAADVEGWEQTRSEVTASLDELGKRIGEVSKSLEGQMRVLRERREEERKPVTGLFEGLDGGEYEAYLVSVVREVQRALREEGYYAGPADGYLGKPTMEAIARYQKDHGLAASGVPSPMTRRRLLGTQRAGRESPKPRGGAGATAGSSG